MSENTFPVYTADAIVNFYRTEVLTGQEAKHFTKSDLTPAPKPESVQTLYMRVLHLLYRFRPECHSMVPLLENIQYPVYHEGATTILSVYVRMRQFLPMCLVYDFSLNDLLAPKKQRTLTVLSAIMNFLHFRKQRMDMTLEKQAKFRADLDRLQIYNKGTLEAEKKIEMLTTIPPEQQAEADELVAALSELQATTAHEYQDVNAKNDSIAEWKTRIAEKTQKLAQVKVDVSNLKEDIGKLKSQIVESPEELKSQMEKMRENVKNIKTSIEGTDGCVVELQGMVQNVTHTEAEIQQMFNLLQDLESSMNNTKQRQEEHHELTAQYEKKQKELKNLCIEEGQLKRAQAMKLDKESKQNIRRQKKKEMKEQHVQEVLGQCNQIHQKREEMADKIQEISRETQQLKAKIQSLRDVCSKETEKAQALYDTLSTSMDELHWRIETHTADLKRDVTKMSANF
ncbi:Kinetochore protein Nuf2 Cell division cycle-associated protein 1 [Larimichthys crocea]|uniref:Kinetochore protein Nuf2 Cell division cycle-associated protein 1 n=2 Tax=Larimichthys crocea TaxID=215358 RepID=A0A6G0J2B4_LARCR|nr:kinetochore protein Nuf2 [Larimichthys crocea]KAE8297888.1 Kinetochore protein Nuf2 Cell division cycle-associated protein 1 [Larimichthys crocea]TMS19487.1 Kinetochore protein Nuf2 [Larimichthys crocea]